MTIQEKNALIGRFMGWKEQTDPNERWFGSWFDTIGMRHNNLYFQVDWEQLMEVVEKIESFEDENKSKVYNVCIEQCFVTIIHNHTSEEIVDNFDADTKMEAIYGACVQFIEWYNENNPQ